MSDDIDFDFFESPGRTFPNNFSTNSADNSIESATGNPNSQSQTQSEVNTYTKSNGSSNSSTRSDSRSESQLVNQSAQLRRNNNQRYHKYDSQIEKDFQTETSSRHHNRHDSHTDSDVVKRSDKSKSKSTSKTKVSSHGSRKKHCDYSEKVVVQASIPSVMHESSSSGEDSDSDFFNMALDGDNSNARCNSDSRNMSKPPLPRNAKHSDRYSVNRNKHKYHKDFKHTKTKHSKYEKKREQQLSDEEFSDSASSSEEEVRFHRRTKKDLKIDLGDLSPRSDSSETDSHRSRRTDSHRSRKTDSHRSRSRSISPDWSTGSERGRQSCRSAERPSTRRSRRRSSSSGSSISVSSLSDEGGPSHSSREVTSSQKIRFNESPDKDRLNLELLLAALLEDDKIKASSRQKALLTKSSQNASSHRANYTFTSERARTIDQENQRLLNNILAQRASRSRKDGRPSSATSSGTAQKPKSKAKPAANPPMRVTPFSVNRMREQQRIERENLALLKRLNKVKPSADVSRDKALTDYQRQLAYYCPELRTAGSGDGYGARAGAKGRPGSAVYTRPASGYNQYSRTARPASATNRPVSATNRPVSATNRPVSATNRPASATTRPLSATGRITSSVKRRPEWQTGW
ncbi:CFAP97 [Bugula neritina]|uniref:CFAP97 n=1 Tax=Bugula neritina TaxID=10212 RepID=A0A7J7KE92_BUGNE|nr:CFAP97 [Bugula neritina]